MPCAPHLVARLAGEGTEKEVVVLAIADGDTDAVLEDAHDAAGGEKGV